MNISDTLVISQLIENLKSTGNTVTFTNLCDELKQKDVNENPKYYLSMKETDDLFILYYDNLPKVHVANHSEFSEKLEKNTRSCIIEKDTLKIIATQHNRILYNSDAQEYLKDENWNQVVVEQCYEGTILLVYNYKDVWYISTRRCLDASDSTWIKNKSYKEMFDESIEGKFELDDLNKSYCYYFVLVHHKNKNVINYSNIGFGNTYKEVVHIMTTEKYTLAEIDYTINDKVKKPEQLQFDSLNSMLSQLNEINKDNELKKMITMEGYILKYYHGEKFHSPFTVLKFQTRLYQNLIKIKPNNSNMHQSYLELYQTNKLSDYLPYFSKYNSDITKRIHMSMRTLAKEVLDIYHSTRQKKNQEVYKMLREQYKKTLYGLHGLFIDYRKPNYDHKKKEYDNDKAIKSITVHDVYYHLKGIPPQQLRQLFYERMYLMENKHFDSLLNKNCLDTMTLSTLMFQYIKKNNDSMNENSLSCDTKEHKITLHTIDDVKKPIEILVDTV